MNNFKFEDITNKLQEVISNNAIDLRVLEIALMQPKLAPPVYFTTNNGILFNRDSAEMLFLLPKESVDLVITSPPYGTLRDYNGFEFDFSAIAKGLYRVLKDGGIVVWVVNDETINGSESGESFRQALYFMQIGFRLHDTMIYAKKGSSRPAHAKSVRYSSAFEYMFIFSKGKPKTVNLIKDKEGKYHQPNKKIKKTNRYKDGTIKTTYAKTNKIIYRSNIWEYAIGFGNTTSTKEAHKHPALFPEKLVYDHIISWSNPGDVVLDCFSGSGTTWRMCSKTERKFIGIEISEKYCQLTKKIMLETNKDLFLEV